MSIIERVVCILEEKGKTMAELSRVLGVRTSTTSNWKKRHTDPPASLIAPICEFLDVSCEYLLTGSEKEEKVDENEIVLLGYFRKLNDQQKRDILGAIRIQLAMDGAADIANRLEKELENDSLSDVQESQEGRMISSK